ncbi:ribosomal protein L44, mitochondrial [Caerostris darwini]|uniref:Large ribosomal subunit protein mL44 n=1 Tax=Caerostris darwini TaxID=1538125 RepID=A0AAV4WB59_9ARAC|nr:ribosomal protein L44, mitochondrial [Caerostris darwini]
MACRLLNFGFSKILPLKNVLGGKEIVIGSKYLLTNQRYVSPNYGRKLRVMKGRRAIAGSERLRKRSEWDSWNYKAELYAFGQRLNENISEETLRWAFIHDSYIEKEEQKRKELDIPSQNVQLDLKSNAPLITLGEEVIRNYLQRYLPRCFPKLPYEGISAVENYLMSDEVLSHISSNIGTKDLIFCEEFQPTEYTLAASFKAIVGAIVTDNDVPRAENFVLDFVCPQLVAKDVFEIWDLENPLDVLNGILQKHGFEECEPRLIFESGRTTIEAIYHVGLYSNKGFLGRGPGETLNIAVEMAAYNALRKFFGIQENDQPLYFGDKARSMDLSSSLKPKSIREWSSELLNSKYDNRLNA